MTSTQQLQKEQRIKERFQEWNSKQKNGVRKYSYEFILGELSEEFFLSKRTIEAIITGEYDRRREKRKQEAKA